MNTLSVTLVAQRSAARIVANSVPLSNRADGRAAGAASWAVTTASAVME